MTPRAELERLPKAALVDRVVELEAAAAGETVEASIVRLAAELAGSLSPQQQVDLAAARVLARTLDTGPELPQAGISKQLADLVSRLESDDGEVSIRDQLAARRAAAAEAARRTG